MTEKRLTELAFETLCNRDFFPSPAAWEDQVLYFLMFPRSFVMGFPWKK